MGGGSSQENIVKTANSLVATAFIQSTQSCQQNTNLTQQVNLTCNPIIQPGQDYFEDNTACVDCYNSITESQTSDLNQLRLLWPQNRSTSGLNTNASTLDAIKKFQNCHSVCKACVWTNFSQNSTVTFNASCQFNSSMINSMAQNIQGAFSQILTNNQDVLSGLTQALGAKSNTENIINISNAVTDNFSSNLMSIMAQTVNDSQTISYTGGGTSNVDTVTQATTISVLTDFIAKTNMVNNVLSDAQWKTYQTIKNEQNTIGELGDTAAKTVLSVGNVVNTISGQVMVAVIILISIVLVVIVAIAIVKAVKAQKK